MIGPAGEIRWQQWTDRAIFDDAGDLVEFQSVGRDVTERINDQMALERLNKRLTIVHDIYQAIQQARSSAEFATKALEHLSDLVPVQGASVRLFDMPTATYSTLAMLPISDPPLTLPSGVPIDKVLGRAVLLEGQVYLQNDLRETAAVDPLAKPFVQEGILSLLRVPLVTPSAIIGCISLSSSEANGFDDTHLEVVQEVANSMAIAIQQERLRETNLKQLIELKRLREIGMGLTADLELDSLLNTIVQSAIDLVDAHSGGLYLYHADTDLLEWVKTVGDYEAEIGTTLKRGEGLSGKVLESGELLYIADYPNWPGKATRYANLAMKSLVGLPIRWHNEMLGVLLLMYKDVDSYSPDKNDLLHLFAAQVAVAIQNARSYSDQQQISQQLSELIIRQQELIEAERSRLAREIHDGFGQILTAIKIEASWLAHHLASQDALQKRLAGLTSLVDLAIQEMRQVAVNLRPMILDNLGLDAAVEWELAEFSRRTGIPYDLDIDPENGFDVAQPVATAVFRIFQESLTNIARHAQASSLDVVLSLTKEQLYLCISDNGRGFLLSSLEKMRTLGILGMQERARSVGGRVEIESNPGKGTAIRVVVPAGSRDRG